MQKQFGSEMSSEEFEEEVLAHVIRPFAVLEIESEDGRTYSVYTGRNTVSAVLDAETEEVLWIVLCGGQ